MTTRPGNAERPLYLNLNYDNYPSTPKHFNEFVSDVSAKSDDAGIRPSNVAVFKLADEAQMGSLNSLMISYETKTKNNNNVGEEDEDVTSGKRNNLNIQYKISIFIIFFVILR